MKLGNGFSLPSPLESVVAEKIISLVPSAEMVRFGKNGTDATSAAIRLARAYTGREFVAVCGYHGWQDWFIGSTSRKKGVPSSTSNLTLTFSYNDIDSLKMLFSRFPKQIAAVILEPMTYVYPEEGFLQRVKTICEGEGAVLVFDETITGFRFHKGGAQQEFGVMPDLSTFGKGIANGYPLSVICGKREIMREMENIFFSGTFGGELLSLAAANEVLDMHQKDEICPALTTHGMSLSQRVGTLIHESKMEEFLDIKGHPTWKFLIWKESRGIKVEELKTFFMQEMFKRGVLVLATHNVTLSHKGKALERAVNAYEDVLNLMRKEIDSERLLDKLEVEPLEPLFKVR
jgi:glutamate-1-semialdehyde 2,1-aminomutase